MYLELFLDPLFALSDSSYLLDLNLIEPVSNPGVEDIFFLYWDILSLFEADQAFDAFTPLNIHVFFSCSLLQVTLFDLTDCCENLPTAYIVCTESLRRDL